MVAPRILLQLFGIAIPQTHQTPANSRGLALDHVYDQHRSSFLLQSNFRLIYFYPFGNLRGL
jgi:hypothetical protein